MASHLRRPQTTYERRASYASPIKVRAARNSAHLPDAWDDKPAGRRQRTDRYKNHRRP